MIDGPHGSAQPVDSAGFYPAAFHENDNELAKLRKEVKLLREALVALLSELESQEAARILRCLRAGVSP